MQQAPGLLQFAFMDLPKRDTIERAQQLHDMAIVVDTHGDTTQRLLDPTWNIAERHDHGHVDIPRLREGGCGAVFFAVWAPGPVEPGAGLAAARRQIDCIRKTVSGTPMTLCWREAPEKYARRRKRARSPS